MACTPFEIQRLRRMVNEPDIGDYSNDTIAEYVELYNGDLHAAAAVIWQEKAGAVSAEVDFTADGVTAGRSQRAIQYNRMAEFHRKRAKLGRLKLNALHTETDE